MWKAETVIVSISDSEVWGHASHVSFLFVCAHKGKDNLSSENGQRILVFALFVHTKADCLCCPGPLPSVLCFFVI